MNYPKGKSRHYAVNGLSPITNIDKPTSTPTTTTSATAATTYQSQSQSQSQAHQQLQHPQTTNNLTGGRNIYNNPYTPPQQHRPSSAASFQHHYKSTGPIITTGNGGANPYDYNPTQSSARNSDNITITEDATLNLNETDLVLERDNAFLVQRGKLLRIDIQMMNDMLNEGLFLGLFGK
ncbi:uncharacterized protein LOC129942298 [Eupeodes corollae]|uniref:uncharacterized protein LOC129942298 n=1 Tax=Eupeodes corollae TaxID=290404 RepID=UPI00248F6DD2|nr:uncharacterized protein LOC129942298 [Eupeodes corollae]